MRLWVVSGGWSAWQNHAFVAMWIVMKIIGIILYTIIILAISRIIPHPPNFTPILAIAVTLPMITNNKAIGTAIPLFAIFLSDILIGFYSYMIWIYLSFIVISLSSYLLLRRFNLLNVTAMSLASCLVFFVVTNFGFWTTGYYGYTFNGLITAYIMAIPFATNTILSTLLYSLLIYFMLKSKERIPAKFQRIFN